MPSTPTPRLRVMQQARGENINAWGDPNLNNALQRLEEGQAKVLTLAITGNVTLSVENYLEDQARSFVLVLVGTPAAAFKVTIPSVEKPYLVDNRTGQVASIGAASGAVAAVRAGIQSMVFCDASDTYVVDLTLDRIRAAAAPVNLNGQRLTNLAPATSDTDATTRKQVTDLTAASVTLASQWATKLNGMVDGSEYSAKEYAVGATTPLGSAKAWATSTAPVAAGQKGAHGYANDAASSASSAGTSAGTASTAAQTATDKLADFNSRYVVGGGFPATGNFAGRLAFDTTGSQFGVYNATSGAYDVIALPSAATEAQLGLVRLASQAVAEAGTDNERALTSLRVAQAINSQVPKGPNVAVATKTDTFTLTATSTWVTIPGLSVTITPRSSSSKILLEANVSCGHSSETQDTGFRFVKNGNPLTVGDADGTATQANSAVRTGSTTSAVPVRAVEQSGNTQARTYELQMRIGSSTGYINRPATATISQSIYRLSSTSIAMEIVS